MDSVMPENGAEAPRCGIVALIGRANVGKSTLINRIVGEKVSIVSPVAQTTRNTIRAIHNDPRGQLVFLDTPGIHKATHDLGKLMNRNARVSIEGADVALLVLDASTPPRDEDTGWMRKLAKSGLRPLLVLNKEDKSGKKFHDDYRRAFEEIFTREERADDKATHSPPSTDLSAESLCVLSISAETGQGVEVLIRTLFDLVPEGPPLFDEDILTDFPRRLAIADVVREKLFHNLRDELPHAVAVNVTDLKETAKEWKVDADILVERQSQKYIVIGRKGALLKNVRAAAERELSDMFDVRIRLNLWVKVERHWARNFWILKQLGHTG